MPLEPATPNMPPAERLRAFFARQRRSRVPVAQLAELLGTPTEALEQMIEAEGTRRRRGASLAWSEAAAYLFDAWPRAAIFEALGPDAAKSIPCDFQLTRVSWLLPLFIVRAMEHQAVCAWRADVRVRTSIVPNHLHARGIDDYIGDLLYAEIEPATLAAFRKDSDFLRAFHYPELE